MIAFQLFQLFFRKGSDFGIDKRNRIIEGSQEPFRFSGEGLGIGIAVVGVLLEPGVGVNLINLLGQPIAQLQNPQQYSRFFQASLACFQSCNQFF